MTLIIAILFLLIVSRVAAELAERVGQPAMIGEIVAGLLASSATAFAHITVASGPAQAGKSSSKRTVSISSMRYGSHQP